MHRASDGAAAGGEELREAGPVTAPLYQLKAEFFKTLGHPVRIRVLELLSEREHAVAEMLPGVGVGAPHLSQQLAVLRRMNLVVTRKEGPTVYYSLTSPEVAELLRVARQILSGVLSGQVELLADLRSGAAEAEADTEEEPGRGSS
jgi:DNA-binding transcriptional ArsR family regulator